MVNYATHLVSTSLFKRLISDDRVRHTTWNAWPKSEINTDRCIMSTRIVLSDFRVLLLSVYCFITGSIYQGFIPLRVARLLHYNSLHQVSLNFLEHIQCIYSTHLSINLSNHLYNILLVIDMSVIWITFIHMHMPHKLFTSMFSCLSVLENSNFKLHLSFRKYATL